jgi:hypothetical protein
MWANARVNCLILKLRGLKYNYFKPRNFNDTSRYQRDAVWTSTGLPCTCTYTWPHAHPISTCTEFDVRRNLRNVNNTRKSVSVEDSCLLEMTLWRQMIPDVSEDRSVFIFRVKRTKQTAGPDCLTIKYEGTILSKRREATHPTRRIPQRPESSDTPLWKPKYHLNYVIYKHWG